MNIKTGFLLATILLGIALESCRPPRCPLRSCHIRMKHRHPSKDGEGTGGFDPNAGFDPRTGEALTSTSGGPVYRGVPFWARKKNPKIGEGFKEGYKYRHRKEKPLTAKELKKIEEKNKRKQEKLDRKKEKAAQKADEVEEESQSEETPAEAVDGAEPTESKSEKRQKRKKRKEAEAAPEEDAAPEQDAPEQQQPAPVEEEEKDGF